MDLQKDMVVFLLSMLEGTVWQHFGSIRLMIPLTFHILLFFVFFLGNVVNGTIGKQMVDMLVESTGNVEMILRFFDMFLKLKDFTSSDAFREYNADHSGCISRKEFQKAMENCKRFSAAETNFILSCTETNKSETVDYKSFVECFHEPAKDIGFSIAVLLTNLSEHMPKDSRLQTFLEPAACVLTYFRPYLGRIEILGSGKRIERVYFEISQSSRTQWEKPQVKESKRQFIFDVINKAGEKEKMEMFVNFCEDTIFEMQLAAQISDSDPGERNAENGQDGNSTNKEEEEAETNEMSFLGQWFLLLTGLFSLTNLKTLMRMTLKEVLVSVLSLVKVVLKAQVRWSCLVIRTFLYVLFIVFVSGGLIEKAKRMKISDLFAGILEPTLDEVTNVPSGVNRLRKYSACFSSQTELREIGKEAAVTPRREVEVVSDIFGLKVKKEGGQYRIMAQDLTGSLSDLFSITSVDFHGTHQKKV